MASPDFWDNVEEAQKTVEKANAIKSKLTPLKELQQQLDDFEALLEMWGEEEGADKAALADELGTEYESFNKKLDRFELLMLMSGDFDRGGAYITIHAGAGGTESCDWADMLYRMYQRWMERSGYNVSLVDISEGEEAGIRSVTMHAQGEYAFGYLNTERGVHRLVRISPFDANKRRHTSFASVDVVPEVNDDIDIEIAESDLEIGTMRSGGKGGQNVNKVESGVFMKHIPTGLTVKCTVERSQHKNRDLALKILKAKIYQMEEEKRERERAKEHGEKSDIAWGSQIRSYVFQPYQMVKDHRTGVTIGNIQDVMDGNITEFIHSKLRGVKAGDGDGGDDDLD
jgi:peptide chain release factor 2